MKQSQSLLERQIQNRLDWLERTKSRIVALSVDYPDGYRVPLHRHSRGQLLHALTGVVLVTTPTGRWMVPPEHGLWIPSGTDHTVEMLGDVNMRSTYLLPDAVEGLPDTLRVVGLTRLMRSLLAELGDMPPDPEPGSRDWLVMSLLLAEMPRLPVRPLGLPLPADPRLATLCRRFVAAPSARAAIDDWAGEAGMSRRTFTRAFQRETGLGLSTWRRQACLFAALPRLAHGEPVTTVALDLGYNSVPAFTTMFCKMLGQAPRDYFRDGAAWV